MEKYPNAVVYRLKCYTTNTYYIGSAVNLRVRMNKHICKKNNASASKSIIAGENYGEPKILLEYPCNDIKQLHEMEQGFLDKYREKYGNSVLNNYNAYLTEEERKEKKKLRCANYRANNLDRCKEMDANYYQNNRKKKGEYNTEYYLKNKKKLLERYGEKFDCECGGIFRRADKARHLRTKKHQNFIQNQNQNQIQTPLYESHEGSA